MLWEWEEMVANTFEVFTMKVRVKYQTECLSTFTNLTHYLFNLIGNTLILSVNWLETFVYKVYNKKERELNIKNKKKTLTKVTRISVYFFLGNTFFYKCKLNTNTLRENVCKHCSFFMAWPSFKEKIQYTTYNCTYSYI